METVPPAGYDQLADLLRTRWPKLAAGQRRIANLLLTDPEGTAFRSISETAKLAEVHESSLVRFAAALGLSGYPALAQLCRAQLAEQAQLVRRFEQAGEHSGPDTLLAAVAEHDGRNLARTFAMIDPARWQRAVEMLADAPAVSVIGLRKCFTVAYLLNYLLHVARPGVRQLATTPGLLVDDLRDLSEGDTLVAVSIHRYTADTVRALAYAKAHGLQTIALTDNAGSPLAEHADVTLYIETSGVTIMRSLTAFIAVVQALATDVAVRLGGNTRAELLADEKLLEDFDVYFDRG
ncbi:MurR/RpiR family transcriptional regulator [Actinocrispum wychmicini]|uniref:RpiR family transcriptional regulator n=1 Tax=Actinocrispum wychmicini TaxID=1213861 RepID=A0A4R2J6Z9_9PSEU|nr:MurR/RpiR family transcriptional regulator [Actinocrispum wychmicini]TCO54841.1 RpiR family transcriptional regulator [Actinocrispum wychmicini]